MSEPRAVVIGYGYAGRSFHSYLIGLDSGLVLHGVSSRNPETREKIRRERDCRAYEGFGQVIADPEVDLVVLATPHDTHADLAVRAMDAGKHVVTDKPMCTTLAECDRMIEASERNGVLLTIFQNRRWDGDYLTLRKLLDEGALGELRWLEMAWQVPRPPGRWRGEAAHGGGRLFDLGTHMIDQCLQVFPQAVESVYCRMHHDYAERDVDSHAMVVIGFDDGATAVVDAGGMHYVPKPRINAFGRAGTFVKHGLDPQEAAMKAGDIDSTVEPPEHYGRLKTVDEDDAVRTLPGRWRSFYENVADALSGRAPLAVTPWSVRRDIAVLDAAFQSARSGEVVHPAIPALDD